MATRCAAVAKTLEPRFRFRLKPSGASLRLEALDPQQRAPLWWVRPRYQLAAIPTGLWLCSWSRAGPWNAGFTRVAR